MTYTPTHPLVERRHCVVLANTFLYYGTMADVLALQIAMEHNCPLRQHAEMGHTTAADAKLCPVHGLAFDQRVLDHLAFVRTMADQFIRGEFIT